jgi:uncharacterized membrane protein
MRELFIEIMSDYAREIVFIHILSAIIWVGGMIAIRLAVKPSLVNIQDDNIRIARVLEIMKRFFSIVTFFIFLLIVTAVVFIIGLDLKNAGSIYKVVIFKEAIWTIMVGIFIMIYASRNKAERLFVSGDIAGAKGKIGFIEKMILVNIILGLISLYFGVILRGY